MLQQGDRLDWFNSQPICALALVSRVTIPLFVAQEWDCKLPLFRLQLLGRPNLACGAIALSAFILISQPNSSLPDDVLRQVQGVRAPSRPMPSRR